MSSSIKQTLKDYGLSTTLTVRTTGQQAALYFPKGTSEIPVSLSAGPYALEGKFVLAELDAPDGEPDLVLRLEFPYRGFILGQTVGTTPAVTATAPAPTPPVVPEAPTAQVEPVVPEAPKSVSPPTKAPIKK